MVLLDTHLGLWAAFEPQRLSKRATKLPSSREDSLAFSMATLWEVAIKTSLGRPGFSVDSLRFHQALLAEEFIELATATPHIARLASLARVHRDPFDRLLVAQAIVERITLLTADTTLKFCGRLVGAV